MLQVEVPPHYPIHASPCTLDIFPHWYCVNICNVDQIHLGAVSIPGMWLVRLFCCKGVFSHQNIAPLHCRHMVEICIGISALDKHECKQTVREQNLHCTLISEGEN